MYIYICIHTFIHQKCVYAAVAVSDELPLQYLEKKSVYVAVVLSDVTSKQCHITRSDESNMCTRCRCSTCHRQAKCHIHGCVMSQM